MLSCRDNLLLGTRFEQRTAGGDFGVVSGQLLDCFEAGRVGDLAQAFGGGVAGVGSVVEVAYDFQQQVRIKVEEQEFLPGMGPGSGGGGGGGKRKGGGGDKPYGNTQYDHILSNMKFD